MSKTLKLSADSAADIEKAAAILRDGGTVAFPTETVYGLGASALDRSAVSKIFTAKKRPSWDPLIVHVADRSQLSDLVELDEETGRRVEALSSDFWPGPLTLLLPKKADVPDEVTAGRALVGIRIPAHPTAQKLLRLADIPVAAPSANTFGHTSPTTAQHVLTDLDGRIDAVLDGGPAIVGVESTVIDPTQTPIILYRPGAIAADDIAGVAGIAVLTYMGNEGEQIDEPEALPSPGFGIRHYAPRARVILTADSESDLNARMRDAETNAGVLLPTGWAVAAGRIIEHWGKWDQPAELAANLFAGLRALDELGAAVIFCPLPRPGGLNDAIRDRLMKAARPR